MAEFAVLLGADFAGKSSVMKELARLDKTTQYVSTDDSFVGPGDELISRLRRAALDEVLPSVGRRYSADFFASLLQTAVVHLRDRVCAVPAHRPALVDSYYYKILAKCRLAGVDDHPMFSWWRSFPQPSRVLYLDVTAETAWRRSLGRGEVNRWEHYGDRSTRLTFHRFHGDLRTALLDEIRGLPVTVIGEQPDVPRAAHAVRTALAR